MLSSVLALITCAAIPVADPLEVSAQMPADQPAVEVGTYMTSTSFRCRNFSSVNCVLVFGQSGTSNQIYVPLPAYGEVEYAIPPGALHGIYLEVVAAPSPTDLQTSGSIALMLQAGSADGSLWFVPGTSGLVTWEQSGCDVQSVQPNSSMLSTTVPVESPDGGDSYAASQAPSGVPVGSGLPSTPPQSLPPM